jgi:hypothetical protein
MAFLTMRERSNNMDVLSKKEVLWHHVALAVDPEPRKPNIQNRKVINQQEVDYQ